MYAWLSSHEFGYARKQYIRCQCLKLKKKSRLSLFQKLAKQSSEFGCPDESLVAR